MPHAELRPLPRMSLCAWTVALLAATGPATQPRHATGPAPQDDPPGAGLSSAGVRALEAFVRSLVDSDIVAGCVVEIGRREGVLYRRSFGGHTRGAGPHDLQSDAIFAISSLTFPITAVALMTLWEEDRFELDDPVSAYLPELADMQQAVFPPDEVPSAENMVLVPAERPLTIGDLLTARSRIGVHEGSHELDPVEQLYRDANLLHPGTDLDTFVAKLGRLPLVGEPRRGRSVHLEGALLGALAQRIAEQPFDELIRERVIGPLGMIDTGFWIPEEERSRFADAEGMLEQSYRAPALLPSGGGGLVSTVADCGRFSRMLLCGGAIGDVHVLGPETVALISGTLDDDADPENVDGLGHEIGLDRESLGMPADAPLPFGSVADTCHGFLIDPELDLYVVFGTEVFPWSCGHRFELFRLARAALAR